jgi:hypothetical protein
MIRRYALAALAVMVMGVVASAPAEAGGTSGAAGVKKNANVIVKNTTKSAYYVLVVPDSLAGSTKFGTPGTVGWAKKLGATSVSPGNSVVYPVPAGPGELVIWAPGDVPSNPNAGLPAPTTGALYTVKKGKNVTKTIKAGPVIE